MAAEDGCVAQDYFLSDGIYGGMNCIQRDGACPMPQPLRSPLLPPASPVQEGLVACSTLFGPTCDGAGDPWPLLGPILWSHLAHWQGGPLLLPASTAQEIRGLRWPQGIVARDDCKACLGAEAAR